MIEHFTGFGLYDKSFIEVLRNLDDSTPFYRGIVAELGFSRTEIEYTQAKRRAGKTSNNWKSLYDAAWLSFTGYTKIGLRLPVIFGAIAASLSFLAEVIYLILSLINESCSAGIALSIGICFLISVQIFFTGVAGEYILSINERMKKRPLVIEEERLNFN